MKIRQRSRQNVGLRSQLLAFLLALSASAAAAQINTAEIAGIVRDSSGGVLPGATVTARHTAAGIVVERVTDGEGRVSASSQSGLNQRRTKRNYTCNDLLTGGLLVRIQPEEPAQ